jgi:hypothetical protein
MKLFTPTLIISFALLANAFVVKRDGFDNGQPIDTQTGKGAPISGMCNQPPVLILRLTCQAAPMLRSMCRTPIPWVVSLRMLDTCQI